MNDHFAQERGEVRRTEDDRRPTRRGPSRGETPAPATGRSAADRVIAERALADRISAASALAAGVAHELNSPLAYVIANVGFLAEKAARLGELLAGAPQTADDLDLARQLTEALRETRAGTDRMRAVVRDLATFARPEDAAAPRSVDLRPLLESCLNVAWPEIQRRQARLVRELEPLAPVVADPARLSQVFLNLLLNAAQALPEDGGPQEIRVVGRMLPDGRVAVEVHDTGGGIAPEHLPRIFDPFFTTRAPGTGTGLGLAICLSVVTALGGEIEVATELGKGSCFRVLLPAGARESAAARFLTPVPVAGRARVLVVDDEPLVGTMLRRTLSAHDVTVVHSGAAALELLRGGERFDVVLADLIMPEMSGMELYRTVAAAQPALARRFVFLTGGAFTPDARAFLEGEGVEWFEKPFDVGALRAAVARRVTPARPASA